MSTKRIHIIYFKFGGGHDNAKNALIEVFALCHPDWEIIPVNLYDAVLARLDPILKLTTKIGQYEMPPKLVNRMFKASHKTEHMKFNPFGIEDFYNYFLKEGKTSGMGMTLPFVQAFIHAHADTINEKLRDYWRCPAKPDLVLSVIPNFNRIIYVAAQAVFPGVPYMTLMTDMVNLKTPYDFWLAKQDQYVICGTEKAYRQAVRTGYYDRHKITRVSGMILRQAFYQTPAQPLTHADIGLDAEIPTVAIMFGGNGAEISADIVGYINQAGLPVQTIVMCGNNKTLFDKLQARIAAGEITGCHPVGYTNKVADYLGLVDALIGKPGPASISEAFIKGCMVITASKGVMTQELFNLKFIKQRGLGIIIPRFSKEYVVKALRTMLRDIDGPQQFRKNIAALPRNNAAEEIVIAVERAMETNQTMGATKPKRPLHKAKLMARFARRKVA